MNESSIREFEGYKIDVSSTKDNRVTYIKLLQDKRIEINLATLAITIDLETFLSNFEKAHKNYVVKQGATFEEFNADVGFKKGMTFLELDRALNGSYKFSAAHA